MPTPTQPHLPPDALPGHNHQAQPIFSLADPSVCVVCMWRRAFESVSDALQDLLNVGGLLLTELARRDAENPVQTAPKMSVVEKKLIIPGKRN